MIIKHILQGREHSEAVIVEDNLNFSGIEILKEFIDENLKRESNVHFFAYENDKYEFLERLLQSNNFTFHNCVQDPWGWMKSDTQRSLDIEKLLQNGTNLIVIDSVLYMLLTYSVIEICKFIKTVKSYNNDDRRVQFLGVVHGEMIGEGDELRHLKRLFQSVVSLKSDGKGLVVSHKKYAKKLISEVYRLHRDQSKLEFHIVNKEVPFEDAADTSKLTTFKLTLEGKEKEARNQVVLPYMRNSTAKGRIYYEPDENDDWDDEDPDDDLEI